MNPKSQPDDSPQAPHRQWNELLQEMRVMQTGIQILAAFLIVLPFQSRFDIVAPTELAFYVVLLVASVLLIVLLVLPVAVHRHFFGQRVKATTVHLGHVVARIVAVGVGLLVSGCVWFVLQVLFNWRVGLYVGGPLMLVTIFLLLILPRMITPRRSLGQDGQGGSRHSA